MAAIMKPGDLAELRRLDIAHHLPAQSDYKLQRELGITFVYVTHSQSEAFAMADRVVIMNNGQIVFDGLPDEARASNFWNYF